MHSETSDIHARYRFEMLVENAFDPLQRYMGRRPTADQVDYVLSDTLLVMCRRLDDIPCEGALPWCYSVARRTLANHRHSTRGRSALIDEVKAQPRAVVATDELRAAFAQAF